MVVQVPGCMFTFLAEFLEERSTVIVSHFWLQLTFSIMFCYFCKVVVYGNIIVSTIHYLVLLAPYFPVTNRLYLFLVFECTRRCFLVDILTIDTVLWSIFDIACSDV